MNYPLPTFIDNSATLKPLPAVVDGFVMGHNQRQEITAITVQPSIEIVVPATPDRIPPRLLTFLRRPTEGLWQAAKMSALDAEQGRERARALEAQAMESLDDLL